MLLWKLMGVASAVGVLGFAIIGCSKPNPVNPADAAQVRSIDATVERIRQSYVTKDAKTFQSLLMPLESLSRLGLEVERDFAIYDRINLDVGIDRVTIEGTDVAVYFHWQGLWQRKSDDQPIRERGHAIFRLVGHETLALSSVDGDAPFGMTSRRLTGERPSQR
jgi:hypothetical protein